MTNMSKEAAEHHHPDHETVSVADDGRSGVGAAAAAAVSVALAQSWAAVAGGGKSQPLPSSSAIRINKARFKLVAAVPRNVTRRAPVPGQSPRHGAATAAGARGGSPTPSPGGGSNNDNNSMALDSIDDAQELDDTQEATWRASGSHLKLHWLSAPSAVLVVYKPVPEVLDATAEAVTWLLRRGITVIVEPEAYENVHRAAREMLCHICPTQNGNGSNGNSGDSGTCAVDTIAMDRAHSMGNSMFGEVEPLSSECEAKAEAEEAARGAQAAAAVDADDLLHRLLTTWGREKQQTPTPPTTISTFCEAELKKLVPADVAHRLDLVLTLGGDGTVLWACSLFGNGSVPPIVPLAMGSLGFMTPFPLSRMDSVLARVTSVAHGFPLMLRHRLQCRILRGGASAADLTALPDAPCSEDALVLNEVVIDRGMTASLANLQCYVDNNFVTAIQGDGLIVSTPTGSTAYNLAAGGSMVHPSVPCILFTPICAHTLSSRPLVFPEHVTLRVKVPSDSRAEAYCSFDGRGRQALWPGDSVLIHVSQWPVPMVCNLDSSHDWFLSVREGLNWNRRVPQKPMSSSKLAVSTS
jgi:NAD+ kinase